MASNEFVGIEIQLIGGEEAFALLQRIDNSIDTLNKKKKFKSLSGLNSAKQELEGYISQLQKLQKEQEKYEALVQKHGKDNVSAFATRDYEKRAQSISKLRQQIKEMGQDMDSVTRKGRTFKQVFNSVSSGAAHVGSAMQSMGNALKRIGGFMRPITTGLLMGAGYKALNLLTEGFSGAFERADIMRNYSRTLEALGFNASDAEKSIKDLEEAVLGLPTGLDEIVAVQKRFVAASNDIEKSTGVAIAFNNALLASGSDARQRKTAERIMTQLVGGAEIAASSWDALQRAIPMVFNALAKESNMGVADYVQALKNGQIATDDFIKAFTKIGGEGGAIAAAAEVAKKSWGGLSANITNATKRMGEGIIKSLNEVFEAETGRDLLSTLLGIDANGERTFDGIRDWIDDISKSAQDWIKANPDKIIDFFETLKSLDIKGFLKGTAEGIGDIVGYMERLAQLSQNADMEKWGRRLAKAGFLGNLLTIGGGLIKGTRHLWGGIGAGGSWLFGRGKGGGGLFGGLGGGGATGGGGGLGGILGGVSGRGIAGGINVAKWVGIIGGIATLATSIVRLNAANIKASFKSFEELTASLKQGMENLKGIKNTNISIEGVRNIINAYEEVYSALQPKYGGQGVANMSVFKSKNMAANVENMRQTLFGLRKLAYHINKMAGTTVNVDGLAVFVQQIKDAMEELKDLEGDIELDIAVKLGEGFDQSVTATINRIKAAKKEISAQKKGVSFTIPVRVVFSVSTNLGSALSIIRNARAVLNSESRGNKDGGGNDYRYQAKGGMIYRAKGGSVGFPGRPIGTDRIPAWLSAGEFVQNKRAVSAFGIDFMRKVNNLDMKGAMNELMHRAGHMANINRGATITNNNYNNQKVVINNSNAGAGYTFKTASRFVGAF